MNRRLNKLINNDRQIIDLRMQAEDLINNIESISDDQYKQQASLIEKQIDARITELVNQNKD